MIRRARERDGQPHPLCAPGCFVSWIPCFHQDMPFAGAPLILDRHHHDLGVHLCGLHARYGISGVPGLRDSPAKDLGAAMEVLAAASSRGGAHGD